MSGNNNYYINWHIVSFRQFRCCHGSRTNKFSSEHVLYFNFFGAFFGSMFYAKTNYIGITCIFLDLTGWVFYLATSFIDLTIAVGTIGTSFFLL
jgi:hypothetical protein